jgi:hypothetical protein
MRRRRIAIIAVAGAVAAGGTGVAVATNRGDDAKQGEQAVLSDAAKRLGTDADKLRAALAAAEDAQLDADVKAGRLTQAEADQIKQRRKESGNVLGGPGVGGPHGPGFGRFGHFGRGPGPVGNVVETAAKALGLSDEQLVEQLRAGKSLSDVAKTQGKDYNEVKAAVRAAIKTELDAAVKDGRLTQARADRILARLSQRLDDGLKLKFREHRRHPWP